MEMNFDKKLRIAFVIVSIAFLWSLVKLDHYRELSQKTQTKILGGDISKTKTIDSLQHLVDSLHAETFSTSIELGRYEIAYKIFMERNPKAASQYGDIISEETE